MNDEILDSWQNYSKVSLLIWDKVLHRKNYCERVKVY